MKKKETIFTNSICNRQLDWNVWDFGQGKIINILEPVYQWRVNALTREITRNNNDNLEI